MVDHFVQCVSYWALVAVSNAAIVASLGSGVIAVVEQ
jgi:hypothetical protein